ncbi:hypothetical protein AGMMS49556_10190 [Endomicrobiia bacterium]|nr:hypothetical protein AGMMS49556_10190 [Endomicrobiia bacterium]
MRKRKLLISSPFILLGFLVLSSCDKKNASLVNRRTAAPEKIEEIKEKQKAEAKEEKKKNLEARAKEQADKAKQEEEAVEAKQKEAESMEEVCSICQYDINKISKDHIACTNCKKPFHTECIELWLEKNNVCPLCRKTDPIPSITVAASLLLPVLPLLPSDAPRTMPAMPLRPLHRRPQGPCICHRRPHLRR